MADRVIGVVDYQEYLGINLNVTNEQHELQTTI